LGSDHGLGGGLPGVLFEAVAVSGCGANVEGVGGGVYLQSLSQTPVSLQSGTLLITFKPEKYYKRHVLDAIKAANKDSKLGLQRFVDRNR